MKYIAHIFPYASDARIEYKKMSGDKLYSSSLHAIKNDTVHIFTTYTQLASGYLRGYPFSKIIIRGLKKDCTYLTNKYLRGLTWDI